jgi:hypothetical protein
MKKKDIFIGNHIRWWPKAGGHSKSGRVMASSLKTPDPFKSTSGEWSYHIVTSVGESVIVAHSDMLKYINFGSKIER